MLYCNRPADGHQIENIADAYAGQSQLLSSLIPNSQAHVSTAESMISCVSTECISLEIAKEIALMNLTKAFDTFHQLLEARKASLQDSLMKEYGTRREIVSSKLKDLRRCVGVKQKDVLEQSASKIGTLPGGNAQHR